MTNGSKVRVPSVPNLAYIHLDRSTLSLLEKITASLGSTGMSAADRFGSFLGLSAAGYLGPCCRVRRGQQVEGRMTRHRLQMFVLAVARLLKGLRDTCSTRSTRTNNTQTHFRFWDCRIACRALECIGFTVWRPCVVHEQSTESDGLSFLKCFKTTTPIHGQSLASFRAPPLTQLHA